LAIVNKKLKRFEYYDSMSGGNPRLLANLRRCAPPARDV
jgi:Ulp1 family protease